MESPGESFQGLVTGLRTSASDPEGMLAGTLEASELDIQVSHSGSLCQQPPWQEQGQSPLALRSPSTEIEDAQAFASLLPRDSTSSRGDEHVLQVMVSDPQVPIDYTG